VLLDFVIGGILLFVVGLIPVLGPIAAAVAGCLGFGAIVLRALAMRRQREPV
jgi:hypothetical protein